MLLFKRILGFQKLPPQPADKRRAPRYPVGGAFPFKAVLELPPRGDDGEIALQRPKQPWAGRLMNVSEVGALIYLHAAALAKAGDECLFRLSHGEYILEFDATVAHFRAHPQYTALGLSFRFSSPEIHQAYLQLVEPVAVGSMLQAVAASTIVDDVPGLKKEQYSGAAGALLTVWRMQGTATIYSFDFRMNRYGVRWSEGMDEVEPYGLAKLNLAGTVTGSPFVHLIDSELEDVRWLFCLAVPNLAKAVPADVRQFLGELVA